MTRTAATFEENPVFFSNGDDDLFGVLTSPLEQAIGIGVVMLSGGVHIPSSNRNRIWAELARDLARHGFHCLRFDYSGTGDSGGRSVAYDRARPRIADLEGAVWCLRNQGLERVAIVGTCFGSLTALVAAPAIDDLVALVLLSPLILESRSSAELAVSTSLWSYVRKALRLRTIKALLDPQRRQVYLRIGRAKREALRARTPAGESDERSGLPASGRAVGALARVVAEGVPVLMLFGSEDAHHDDWKRATKGPLGQVLSSSAALEVDVIAGYLHGFPQLVVQRDASSRVIRWLTDRLVERATAPEVPGRL